LKGNKTLKEVIKVLEKEELIKVALTLIKDAQKKDEQKIKKMIKNN
jgi:hypothetical protein